MISFAYTTLNSNIKVGTYLGAKIILIKSQFNTKLTDRKDVLYKMHSDQLFFILITRISILVGTYVLHNVIQSIGK